MTDIDGSSILTDGNLWGAAIGIVSMRCASVSIWADGRQLFGQWVSPCNRNGSEMPNRQIFNAEHMQITYRQLEGHLAYGNIELSNLYHLLTRQSPLSGSPPDSKSVSLLPYR